MNYKPEKSTLIAYLYGELDKEERDKVEKYLDTHPETAREVEELKEVRQFMGKLPDKEVIEPAFDWEHNAKLNLTYQSMRFLKPFIGIAASVILVLLAGYFTHTNILVQKNGLVISFGSQPIQTESIDKSEIHNLVVAQVDSKIDQARQAIVTDLQNEFPQQNQSIPQKQSAIDKKIENQLQLKEERLQKLIKELQAENLKILADYIEQASKQQEIYFQTILADFTNYIENQREEDLRVIEANLRNLKDNSDLQFQETGQILASIINTVNTEKDN